MSNRISVAIILKDLEIQIILILDAATGCLKDVRKQRTRRWHVKLEMEVGVLLPHTEKPLDLSKATADMAPGTGMAA